MAFDTLDLMRNVDALLTFRAGATITGTLGKHADMTSGSGNWVRHFQPWTVTDSASAVHTVVDTSEIIAVSVAA